MIYLNNHGVKTDWGRSFKWVALAAVGLFAVDKCGTRSSYAEQRVQPEKYVMSTDSASNSKMEDSIIIYGDAMKSYVEATQVNN